MKKFVKFFYVYVITNTILNKQYVGSKMCYKDDPNNDGYWGSSKYLNEDYKIYGKENFKKEILQIDYKDKNTMLNGETEYILKYNTLEPNGYNRFLPNDKKGFHREGIKHSKETKLKMSLSSKGKSKSEKAKENMSKSHIGHIPWNKNKPGCFSDETLEKMSENCSFRRPEVILKIRKALIGRTQSEESNKKRSKALIGFKQTKESIEKSAMHRRKVSDEMIIDVINMKKNNITSNDTHKKYLFVTLRTIQSIRAGKYNHRILL